MALALLVMAVIILFFLEGPQLWKQKLTRDLVVFCVFLLISAYYGVAQIYGWITPNPLQWLLPLFHGIRS